MFFKIRFVFISDTHSRMDKILEEIPNGDVLIHAGDFSNVGKIQDVIKFSSELKSLDKKFKYKIVIAGLFRKEIDLLNKCKVNILISKQ